jgi:NB-ARC domain
VLALVEESGTPSSKYLVDLRGSQGVQVGDRPTQINYFYAESSSVAWPLQVGAIPLLADCFQKREAHSDRLDQVVATGGTAVLTQVLSGLGGIGKTQLAAACARRVWQDDGVELLVWATARNRAAIQATYAQAGTEISQSPLAGVEQASEWFLGWLQTTTRPWMVVLDDLHDPADLQGLWPDGPTGRVLVTTRRRDATLTDRGRQVIKVGLYTPNEAVTYLQKKIASADSHRLDEAAELASDLGYLPLALAQAAAFIRNRHDTCAGYRRRLHDRRRRLSDVLPADALADDYRSTVAATWSISIELADRLTPLGLARPTLQLASGLDPNGAPAEVFTTPAALSYLTGQRDTSIIDRHNTQVDDQDCRDYEQWSQERPSDLQ